MKTLDADTIIARATPVVHQQAHEIQPFGHLVRMPIALSETACREAVDNLNQLLADTTTLRDLYKKHHWQVAGPTFYQLQRSSSSARGPSARRYSISMTGPTGASAPRRACPAAVRTASGA